MLRFCEFYIQTKIYAPVSTYHAEFCVNVQTVFRGENLKEQAKFLSEGPWPCTIVFVLVHHAWIT